MLELTRADGGGNRAPVALTATGCGRHETSRVVTCRAQASPEDEVIAELLSGSFLDAAEGASHGARPPDCQGDRAEPSEPEIKVS